MRTLLILLVSFCFISCTNLSYYNPYDYGYNLKQIGRPFCSLTNNNPQFKTYEDCENSIEFTRIQKDYEESMKEYYQTKLYQQDYLYCGMVWGRGHNIDHKKEKYNTQEDCEKSNEYKMFYVKLQQEKNKKHKLYEKNRIERIKTFCRNNPTFNRFQSTAIEKKIAIGMPEELLILSWGNPKEINKIITSMSTHKQFVYALGSYVYTDGNVITTIQN